MLKRISLVYILLALAGCTSNNNNLNPEAGFLLKLTIGVSILVAVFAAFAAILIRDSSERRFTAGIVAMVAVIVGVLFMLVLVA